MKWYTDSKYGIFIHFGLYSQLIKKLGVNLNTEMNNQFY
jgi:hypothetical protein